MMARIVSWLLGLPAVVVLILFALANRHPVPVSLDPISPERPWLGFEFPLWVVFYAGILLGLVAGGVATWIRQAKWRRKARRLERELAMERTARRNLERELTGGASGTAGTGANPTLVATTSPSSAPALATVRTGS